MIAKEWLNQEPPAQEISKNNDGSEFIPIAIVEGLLDEYTDRTWKTCGFQFSLHPYGTTLLISASVELIVYHYADESRIYRSMVGAITFTDIAYGSNLNFAATALSECIKNAAKKLGPRFGKNLNGRGGDLVSLKLIDEPVRDNKPKMDVITAMKYANAKKTGDIKTQLEIENHYTTE